MTDPHGDGQTHPAADDVDSPSPISEPLKDTESSADDTDVLDGIGGRHRLTWNPITDAGGVTTEVDDRPPDGDRPDSGFQFDLGGALARLAGEPAPRPPTPRPDPIVVDVTDDVSPVAAEPIATEPLAVDVEPLPSRADRTVPPAPLPTRGQDPQTDPIRAPGMSGPTGDPSSQYPRRVPGTHLESQMREAREASPDVQIATPTEAPTRSTPAPSVFGDVPSAPNAVAGAPSLPGEPARGIMPSLPASNPAAPPPVIEPIGSAPSTPDISALRSAQLRASRQQRRGKLFGRSLLAFVVIGGLIAAALVFGRSLLFDTEWDAQLTPIVNDVEAARGRAFDQAVPLEVVTTSELGERLRAATIGEAWVERVPEWRALGLATGIVSAESVGDALVSSTAAIYDPIADRIYLADGIEPGQADLDLRVALEQAFDAQVGIAVDVAPVESEATVGFVGVSSIESIASRAVDEAISAQGAAVTRRAADESLPFPIAYELAAVEVLGEPIIAFAGLDRSELTLGGPHPDSITASLDDGAVTAASGLIQPGEVTLAPAAALGTDDWSLVWGARLPASTVDRMVEQVVADSYRPVDRDGTVCVVAVFQTDDEAAGGNVFASMLTWAANAPAASRAVVTQPSPTSVQLDVCDPGADGGTAPNVGVVDALIDRQQLRLAN